MLSEYWAPKQTDTHEAFTIFVIACAALKNTRFFNPLTHAHIRNNVAPVWSNVLKYAVPILAFDEVGIPFMTISDSPRVFYEDLPQLSVWMPYDFRLWAPSWTGGMAKVFSFAQAESKKIAGFSSGITCDFCDITFGSVLVYRYTIANTKGQTIRHTFNESWTKKTWLFPCVQVHEDRTLLSSESPFGVRRMFSLFSQGKWSCVDLFELSLLVSIILCKF